MSVNSEHPRLKFFRYHWDLISDCLAGSRRIKTRGDMYLPRPNADDVSEANLARYACYLDRAVFYNVTKRTMGGLVGQIFARDPIIEVEPELQVIIDDATGSGVPIIQLSKLISKYVVGHGRCGLWIDYPRTDGPITKAQQGEIRPTITPYRPNKIINWDEIVRGGLRILSLVVLEEPYVKTNDGFLKTFGIQYRVLRLTGGVYTVALYRDSNLQEQASIYTPVDASGKTLDKIPFIFIGPETNDTEINEPPMYDLAELNVAHYRNSADYEESAYIVGQPTPYFAGLSESWVSQVMGGKVQLGSRAAVPLPVGGTAGLLQAQPNTLPFEAMKHKERQMVALGAKLVETADIQRTATETSIDYSNETSILGAAADNVSDAFVRALRFCAAFIGSSDIVKYQLNTEFDLLKLSPQERQEVIAEWQAQALTFSEMRENLRRAGVATLPDEKAKQEIKDNPPANVVAAEKLAEQQAAASKGESTTKQTDSSPTDRAKSKDQPTNPKV